MSSYYEPQGWQAPSATPRQASWEQPVPPSRSGSSSVSQRDDSPAFSSQFDEVDRAIDNLVKSGKLWNAPRRDSMPMMMGRPYPEYDPRMGGPQRHHSVSEFENSNTNNRAHPSGNAQGFYASQRYQGRTNEVDQMMQAKRRMAAQRERELRNYHQEQQYNRSLLAELSASKSDRSLSPAAMSEENHRGLLHRQHRALYGNESPAFFNTGPLSDDNSRPDSQAATPSSTGTPVAESTSSLQSPSRANSTSSPSSAINAGFPDQPGTATSSPGGAASPSSRQAPSKPGTGPIGSVGVGPIGSRQVAGQSTAPPSNPALNKRSTTPLPSPLGFGFTPGEAAASHAAATSASSNPAVAAPAASGPKDPSAGGVSLGWSNGSGVWGSKSGLGVQASVWG
ncbi:hypothetical protein N7481_005265 [Penicillium waksmanii]|uniref:uncharacterized protein n=1 Tax=Penicillium waksmanii TaxID=69791 RepID=UPI002549786F|nr:uncharacterized protein N7481_005265 [Penicillium waksmanii]KAJ5983166.1 hypothetical protein N7481_005265 [Penicillium waksmanii]